METLVERNASVRRTAWVSWSLAAVAVVGFLYAKAARVEVDAVVESDLAAAQAYFEQHPYLEMPPLLRQRLSAEAAERIKASYFRARTARSAPSIPARVQLREQRELEQQVATVASYVETLPAQSWGLRPSEAVPLTFLTHWVFHEQALHLLGNVGLLLFLGYFLEGIWGAMVFACAATAMLAGGALGIIAGAPDFGEPYVGLSGLAAGLLGAFALRFAGARGEVPYGFVLLSGLVVLGAPPWFGIEGSIARGPMAPPAEMGAWNVSYWALLGGFASGAAVALGLGLLGVERSVERAEAKGELRRSGTDPELEQAFRERSAGNLDRSLKLLQRLLRRDPDNLSACQALWDVANDLECPAVASEAVLRLIRHEVQHGDRDNAVRHWLELVATGRDVDAEAALLLRIAGFLREADEPQAAIRALRHALQRVEGSHVSAVATRVAHEAVTLDPQTAEAAAWRALGSLDLDIRERQSLENLLAELQPALDAQPSEGVPLGRYEPEAVVSGRASIPFQAEPEASAEPPESGPIELESSVRNLEALMAVPSEFDKEGLIVEFEGGVKKRVGYDRVEALAVAAVDGLGARTVIVVDLILNWVSLTAEPVKVIRLRGDRFDPRRLMREAGEPLDALRAMVARLLRKTGAIPLPDLQSVRGMPFAAFASLADYQRDVLMIEDDEDASAPS